MEKPRQSRRFSPGRWAVERERCRLADASPPPADAVEPIRDVIPKIMARLGLEQDRWLAELQAEWATVAGAGVASHSRPGRLERGNLTVFVDSSVWLSELSRYGQKQMLANIRRRFGESRVSTLSFRLDPDAGRR